MTSPSIDSTQPPSSISMGVNPGVVCVRSHREYWPGTNTPKSTGNGFDLAARLARGRSIFFVPKTPRAVYEDIVRERVKAKKAGA